MILACLSRTQCRRRIFLAVGRKNVFGQTVKARQMQSELGLGCVAWCLTQYYSGFPQPVCSVACPIRQMCSYRVQRFHARGCIIEGMQSTSRCSLTTCSPFTLSAWRMGATLGQDIINRQHVICPGFMFNVVFWTASATRCMRHDSAARRLADIIWAVFMTLLRTVSMHLAHRDSKAGLSPWPLYMHRVSSCCLYPLAHWLNMAGHASMAFVNYTTVLLASHWPPLEWTHVICMLMVPLKVDA